MTHARAIVLRTVLLAAAGATTVGASARAQAPPTPPARADSSGAHQATKDTKEKRKQPYRPSPLFGSASPLDLTLTVSMRRILGDRDTTKRQHPVRGATIAYQDSAGQLVKIPAGVRVRGIWRLANCHFPPLRLRIAKGAAKGTLFERERSPKLVTHCRNTDDFEQYVLHEYAIYRMHALVTPVALLARLARVTYVDSSNLKVVASRPAILLEDEENLAERLGGRVFPVKGVPPYQLEPFDTFVMSLFQYMIGNTDWSVPGLHNIQIIQTDSALDPRHFALAYDWDFSGLIRTRYSAPDVRLRIRSVRDRLYRGVCPSEADFGRAVALFNEKRQAILAVYDQVPGVEPSLARDGRDYIEDFFRILNDARRLKREITADCERAS